MSSDFEQYAAVPAAVAGYRALFDQMREAARSHEARRLEAVRQCALQLAACPRYVDGEIVVLMVPAAVFDNFIFTAALLPLEEGEDE